MLKFLENVLSLILKLLGIFHTEHEWKWTGEPGSPRWSLEFTFDGFGFHAVIAPSFGRPTNIGRFANYPCVDSIKIADGLFYVLRVPKTIALQELLESGMTLGQAERTLRRALRNEMQRTDDYESGLWIHYRMVVTVKRGRTELGSETLEGITMDPALLMLGGELHVTDSALGLRESLCAIALSQLKHTPYPGVRYN